MPLSEEDTLLFQTRQPTFGVTMQVDQFTLSSTIETVTAELLSHPEGQIIESFRGRFLNHAGCLIACI